MTAIAPSAASAPGQPATRRAARHGDGRGGLLGRLTPRSTPRRLAAWMVLLVVLSLAWGGFGAWTVAEHSAAASSLASTDEPASYYAQQLYLNLAKADVTITTSFLNQAQPVAAGQPSPPTLAARQQMDGYLGAASSDLASIQGTSTSPQFTADVTAITSGLAQYEGAVHDAQAEYALGYIPTGDSFMEVASEDAHLTLLPAAQDIYRIENAAVSSSKGQATSLPTLIIALVAAIAGLFALWLTNQWLASRTRRVVNVGLLAAAGALVASLLWLVITALAVGSNLSTAIGQGANPAESLAQASIDVQQVRGDSILNVIARSGSTTLPADSLTQQKNVDTLLNQALAAGNAQAMPSIRAAIAAAPAWNALNKQGYAYDTAHDFAHEQATVNSALNGYSQLQADIGNALDATQATFTSQADAGSAAFGLLEAGVIIAAILMVILSAWGLYRRLAEYR